MTKSNRPGHRRLLVALGTVVVSAVGAVVGSATPAAAASSDTGKQYLVWTTDVSTGLLAGAAAYGTGGDVLVGDWNGDGKDGFAVRHGNVFYFRNSPTSGEADFSMTFGAAGDRVLVGDWNGDGKDTIAIRRGASFIWTNSLHTGSPAASFSWGRSSDLPLAGDWNGDGKSSFGLRRGTTFFYLNTMVNKAPDYTAAGGAGTDGVLIGDWDGNRTSTVALRRGDRYVFYSTIGMKSAPTVRFWGAATDRVFSGNWVGRLADGRRLDSLGAIRSYDPRLDVWQRTNAERVKAGRSALKYDPCLQARYSQPVTQDNANRRKLEHQRLARKLCRNDAYGENIAAGYTTAQSVLDGWMHSAGHKANILSPGWKVMGAGYTHSASSYRYWWSQNFG